VAANVNEEVCFVNLATAFFEQCCFESQTAQAVYEAQPRPGIAAVARLAVNHSADNGRAHSVPGPFEKRGQDRVGIEVLFRDSTGNM
jgi:hypothetical protein